MPGTKEGTERSEKRYYDQEKRKVELCIVYDDDAFVVDHNARHYKFVLACFHFSQNCSLSVGRGSGLIHIR